MPRQPRLSWAALALTALVTCDAMALGLGDVQGNLVLGEKLSLDIELLLNGKEAVDSACFRLRQPQGDGDVPWVRSATFNLRRGTTTVLEVRGHQPLRDPVIQLGILVACGYEVRRDYTLFFSPKVGAPESVAAPVDLPIREVTSDPGEGKRTPRRERTPKMENSAEEKLAPVRPRSERRRPPQADRLVLSGGGDVGEPVLRFATELLSPGGGDLPGQENRREILRLEFRMLLALSEQANSQLAAAEKLRNMEATLAELQQRAAAFTQRIEGEARPAQVPVPAAVNAEVPPSAPPAPAPAVVAPTPVPQPKPPAPPPAVVVEEDWSLTEWSFYGLLLGAALGVGGWLGWRQYRQRRLADFSRFGEEAPAVAVDPKRHDEFDEFGGVDLHVEPAVMGMPLEVDVPLDGDVHSILPPATAHRAEVSAGDSQFSVAKPTVSEHFEVNPVMELADIMLSFGRVKGAAQALQEFIDHNPKEALQPWIRLLDVYRQAGMREEFDHLACNLNQNFNVEIQAWDPNEIASLPSDDGAGLTMVPLEMPPKAYSVEEMPRICGRVTELWPGEECRTYLEQLLRDNRGGQRAGFALPVVEEILFLIDLRDTIAKMEKENQQGEHSE